LVSRAVREGILRGGALFLENNDSAAPEFEEGNVRGPLLGRFVCPPRKITLSFAGWGF